LDYIYSDFLDRTAILTTAIVKLVTIGRRSMKAVIFAGGLGTRMREETEFRPKPMATVGGKPVLRHIMGIFAAQGVTDFVILTGYKGEHIKRYFFDYEMLNRDFSVQLGGHSPVEYLGPALEDNWKVSVIDTGLDSMTGERLLRAKHEIGEEPFFLTYGDGLANVNLKQLSALHAETGAHLTISTSKPRSRFGVLEISDAGVVDKFLEKPEGTESVNIGYMIANRHLFDYILPGESLETGPMQRLAAGGHLSAYYHKGYWQAMDTLRELEILGSDWNNGAPPWMTAS
jgi:glucose-1-phosphate cytidylyltransferase